jgi:hypothetical protein
MPDETQAAEARPWRTRTFERVRLLDASKMERVIIIEADLSLYPLLHQWEVQERGLLPVPLLVLADERLGKGGIECYAERYEITDESGKLVPSTHLPRPNFIQRDSSVNQPRGTDLCALIDPSAGRHRVLKVTTWERAAQPLGGRAIPVAPDPANEAHVELRGLSKTQYYEFEIIVPEGVRLAKAMAEFDRESAHSRITETVEGPQMRRRVAPEGSALHFALSPCEEISGNAWFNLIPDPQASWIFLPIIPFVACLLLTMLAKQVTSSDTVSIVAILLLAIPFIVATLTSIGTAQMANRFFPSVGWAAVSSYLIVIAESVVIAFKLPVDVLLRWSLYLTTLAFVMSVISIIFYVRARSHRR